MSRRASQQSNRRAYTQFFHVALPGRERIRVAAARPTLLHWSSAEMIADRGDWGTHVCLSKSNLSPF
jgi:hypothetical protein